jgi:hypothetical protein
MNTPKIAVNWKKNHKRALNIAECVVLYLFLVTMVVSYFIGQGS